MNPVEIVPATFSDLADVMEIERSSFRSPWPENLFIFELNNKNSRFKLARTRSSMIAGYMIYWHVADEIHLLSIAVKPDMRGAGIGRLLMEYMISEGRRLDCSVATLEVRRSNLVAQGLYGSLGFIAESVRPRYYSDNNEDAIVMLLRMGKLI